MYTLTPNGCFTGVGFDDAGRRVSRCLLSREPADKEPESGRRRGAEPPFVDFEGVAPKRSLKPELWNDADPVPLENPRVGGVAAPFLASGRGGGALRAKCAPGRA